MRQTCRAMQVSRPGVLDLGERTVPLDNAREAYRRMASGEGRCRSVLSMGEPGAATSGPPAG